MRERELRRHVRRDHARRVGLQQGPFVIIGCHLLEEVRAIDVRRVADDAGGSTQGGEG